MRISNGTNSFWATKSARTYPIILQRYFVTPECFSRGSRITATSGCPIKAFGHDRLYFRFAVAIVLLLISARPSFAEEFSQVKLNKLISTYYYSSSADQVPKALQDFLRSDNLKLLSGKNEHVLDMFAYFFGRAAAKNTKLLREYEKEYAKADPTAQAFLLKIFEVYRDGKTEKFLKSKTDSSSPQAKSVQILLSQPPTGKAPYLREVDNLWQMDFLWIEFFVTGDLEPIQKIVNVLSWKDVFKDKLQNWMLTAQDPNDKAILSSLLRDKLKADVDIANVKINYVGDLDCFFGTFVRAASEKNQNAQTANEIKRIVGLSDKDTGYISVKGAALAGLWLNALKQPKIAKFCQDELKKRKDKSAVELQNISNAVNRAQKAPARKTK